MLDFNEIIFTLRTCLRTSKNSLGPYFKTLFIFFKGVPGSISVVDL